jgi:hypothetical protein
MENGNAPATKQDLVEVRQGIAELKQELAMNRSESQHMYDDLTETVRDNQTELLRAFYNIANTHNTRLSDLEGAVRRFAADSL